VNFSATDAAIEAHMRTQTRVRVRVVSASQRGEYWASRGPLEACNMNYFPR